jgi:hypothetical protein
MHKFLAMLQRIAGTKLVLFAASSAITACPLLRCFSIGFLWRVVHLVVQILFIVVLCL